MKVTEVRISSSKGGRVRAFASVVFDDCFVVNDLRVMEGRENQLFVSMPARPVRRHDLVGPPDNEARNALESAILAAYRGEDWRNDPSAVEACIVSPDAQRPREQA
jgi:stage V sporulation protein G